MAYPAPVAAALSGASVRQLVYWRNEHAAKGALLVPEYRPSPGRILYSFRDLMALRTFVYLRGELSLQRIRQAVANLRELGNRDHLSEYRLVAVGDSVVLAEDQQHAIDLVRRPGAGRMLATLGEVFAEFPTSTGEVVVDLYRPRRRLTVNPEVRGGYPVIENTRLPFDQVATLVDDGVEPSRIRQFYPGVTAPAARDAHNFALYVEHLKQAS